MLPTYIAPIVRLHGASEHPLSRLSLALLPLNIRFRTLYHTLRLQIPKAWRPIRVRRRLSHQATFISALRTSSISIQPHYDTPATAYAQNLSQGARPSICSSRYDKDLSARCGPCRSPGAGFGHGQSQGRSRLGRRTGAGRLGGGGCTCDNGDGLGPPSTMGWGGLRRDGWNTGWHYQPRPPPAAPLGPELLLATLRAVDPVNSPDMHIPPIRSLSHARCPAFHSRQPHAHREARGCYSAWHHPVSKSTLCPTSSTKRLKRRIYIILLYRNTL